MKLAKRRVKTLRWSMESVPSSPPMLGVVRGNYYVVFDNVHLTVGADVPPIEFIAERVWRRPRR